MPSPTTKDAHVMAHDASGNFVKSLALFSLAVLATTAPLSAREVERQEVAERFDTEAAQERQIFCRDTKVFTLSDGSEYRACVNWRAQNRTRVIRTYAALDGPEEDSDENLDLARECFEMAVASQNDPYRTTFVKSAFIAGAQIQFGVCARDRKLKLAEDYSLRTYETGVWLGGS